MKRKFFPLLLLLLCAAALLAACKSGGLPSMTYHGELYKNPATGVSYRRAPVTYAAETIREDRGVAELKRSGMESLTLYEIDGEAPERFLAGSDFSLFYADGLTLPALWEMNVSRIQISQTVLATVQLQSVSDAAVIDAVISAYRDGESFPKSEIDLDLVPERFDLNFSSSAYPGLCYCLTYWQFEEEVCVYLPVEDPENFEPVYHGVPVTTEDYLYTKVVEGKEVMMVEHLAVYHFGTGILYDRDTGLCYSVGTTLEQYVK